jgi:hypothetical protein
VPVWLYAAAGALAVGSVGGWVVRDAFCDAAKADVIEKAMKAAEKQAQRANEAAGRLEDYRDVNDQDAIATRREIRTIYRDRVVRVGCDIDPASRGLLDRARDNANAAASGEPRIPMPDAAANPQPARQP